MREPQTGRVACEQWTVERAGSPPGAAKVGNSVTTGPKRVELVRAVGVDPRGPVHAIRAADLRRGWRGFVMYELVTWLRVAGMVSGTTTRPAKESP